VDALGERTSTDILAPGDLVDLADPNGAQPFPQTGTSFAAPHVTGTLALLQQRATTAHGNNHLTKKAVILNSADKIKGIIGMDRTVVGLTGQTWSHSDTIPLDPQMGVGELDASRAIRQFDGGEQGPGGVGPIGWDLGSQDDPFLPNRYTLNLHKNDFVSATLVWDREVFMESGSPDT
jgi:subtilisin family serine protease